MKKILVMGMVFASVAAYSQGVELSGRVTDKENKPIPGVVVAEKNSDRSAVTDANGDYTIDLTQVPTEICFINGNEKTDYARIGRRDKRFDVTLAQQKDVINMGYGNELKSAMTAPVSSANPDGRAVTFQQIFDRIPGVQYYNGAVFIRGRLCTYFLVDGFEQPLSSIVPSMIETVDVIKDASATTLYGPRAKNGVVVISTKRPQ